MGARVVDWGFPAGKPPWTAAAGCELVKCSQCGASVLRRAETSWGLGLWYYYVHRCGICPCCGAMKTKEGCCNDGTDFRHGED